MSSSNNSEEAETIKAYVRESYSQVALQGSAAISGDAATPVATSSLSLSTSLRATAADRERLARAFGYSVEELESIPRGANLGASCGNPTSVANIKPGEVVVDLGSGGGIDCFLAAKKVGPTGRVIGLDMTPAMVELAKNNAVQQGISNVEFRLGEIENMPIESNSVDVVISNCVINLVPNKLKNLDYIPSSLTTHPQAMSEIFRILKPGGRLSISDVALKQPLPECLRGDLAVIASCVGSAMLIDDYLAKLNASGFTNSMVVDSGADLNVWKKAFQGQGSPCGCSSSSTTPTTTTCGGGGSSSGISCCGSTGSVTPTASSSCGGGATSGGLFSCCGSSPTCTKPSAPTATLSPTGATSGGLFSCCGGGGCSSNAAIPITPDQGSRSAELSAVLGSMDINSFIASVKVYALKL
ncbi:arsenite methyltransferase [Pelomyxa schiedti]|nr:arsenite methyltransferase [Pelomyxa schiedti]